MQNLIRNKTGLEKPVEVWTAFGQLVLGIVATATAMASFFSDVLDSFTSQPYTLFYKVLFTYMALLCIVQLVCYVVINGKVLSSSPFSLSDRELVTKFRFADRSRKKARMIRILSLIAISIFVFVFLGIRGKEKTRCEEDHNKLGIVITKFSSEPEDGFSGMLFSNLEKTSGDSVTRVDLVKKFIPNVNSAQLRDSLAYLLKCRKSSVIIFGMRNIKEKSFYCNIYLYQMEDTCYRIKIKDQIIPIQDPGLIELENSAEQTEAIARFVEAVIQAFRCQREQSISLLDALIEDTKLAKCPKLLAFSHLIKGNNLTKLGQIENAREAYRIGLTYDRFNVDLLANLKSLDHFVAEQQAKIHKRPKPEYKKKSGSPLAKPDTASFVEGSMKVFYRGEMKNFKGLSFSKTFIIGGITYLFKGESSARLKTDSINLHSYTYRLLPNPAMQVHGFTKKDFKRSICSYSVTKNRVTLSSENISVSITLRFSDATSYVLSANQVKREF